MCKQQPKSYRGRHNSEDTTPLIMSAEDLLVWVYEDIWIETDQIVPDQVTAASDNTLLEDSAKGVAGISNDYARGNHKHPRQVSDILPAKDTATGEDGVANSYARSDHTHHVNISNSVPFKDTGTGTAGTSNVYASATHQHPLNVDPSSANVPLVNANAEANVIGVNNQPQHLDQGQRISADRQTLTFNGNEFVNIPTDQTIIGIKIFVKLLQVIKAVNGSFNEGIRISRNPTNEWSNIQFGSDPNSNSGKIDNQWLVGSTGNN
ncbi:MAG: hypothetical protein EZS28_035999, partial [Streblomastix strix]